MHGLPISDNDRVISLFHEGFIFAKLRMLRENKTLAKNSEFTAIQPKLDKTGRVFKLSRQYITEQ